MIRCHNCGTDNLDGSEYCDECGVRLRSAVDNSPPFALSAPAELAETTTPVEADDFYSSEPLPPEPPAFTTTTSTPKPAIPAPDYAAPPPAKADSTPAATPPPSASRRASEATAHLGATGSNTSALRNQASASGVKPHAKLVITRGVSLGKEFPVAAPEAQIGRWDADNGIFPDIDLDQHDPEAKVSRRHARILTDNGQYMIEDLGSTNGTFINRGRRLIPGRRQPLRSGDELIVGKTFLKFIIEN